VGAFIAGLEPWGLGHVPGFGDGEDWREQWFAWRDGLYRVRAEVGALCEDDQQAQAAERALCAADPAYWLAMWGWIEEPRARDGEDAVKPFAPFAFQVELLQWFVQATESTVAFDGFASKSRGLGATWIFCAAATWGWLFRPWRGKLVSRKEDLVDKPGDLDSMFGKMDFFIANLPGWMLPEGWKASDHRFKLLLKNPVSGAQVAGESTSSKTARGARATYIVYDEAAFIPNFIDVFGTGAGTTDHRFCVSSESFEEGRGWWLTWHEAQGFGPDNVKELDWFLNPYFSEQWFEAERARWSNDPEGFNREYLRDPYAGSDTFVYPTVRNAEFVDEGWNPAWVTLVGIDPGRADDTAIVVGQLDPTDATRSIRWVESYERNLMPAEWYAHILTGIEPQEGDGVEWHRATARDRELLAFFAQLPTSPDRTRFYMDPAGAQKDMSGLSFFDRIVRETKRLRQREFDQRVKAGAAPDAVPSARPIVPLYKQLFSHNRHETRRLAMRELLMRSSFASTAGARRFHDALANYRFTKPSDKSTGQPAPIHDEWSHLVTAGEYVAVMVSLGLGSPATTKREEVPRLRLGQGQRRADDFVFSRIA